MQVLGDAVARDRRSDAPALRGGTSGRTYDYRRFCTTAWKVGNLLRNEGVRGGMTVAVADDPSPEAVLTLYGAGLLGATVTFDPADREDAPRALVVPADRLDAYEPDPRTRVVVYGGEPPTPDVAQFERDVWSENPTRPPDAVDPARPLLRRGETTYSHEAVLAAARTAADSVDLGPDDEVAVRGPFGEPGVVAAGLVAPVVAGATVLLPAAETCDADDVGDLADVGVGTAVPERRAVDPDGLV